MTNAPPVVNETLETPGEPLDASTRAFMESRFARDFSRVQVHTDSRAAESAAAVNAEAYTVGRDIVFGEDRYRPSTSEGRRLIAHELAHVTQQDAVAPGAAAALTINQSGDAYELAADRAADAAMASAAPLPAALVASPVVQRQETTGVSPPLPSPPVPSDDPAAQHRRSQASRPADLQQPTAQSQEPRAASGPSAESALTWTFFVRPQLRAELVNDFQEMARAVTVDAKQQVREFVRPYSDGIQTGDFWANWITGWGSQFSSGIPNDPGADQYKAYSLSSGFAPLASQGVQFVMGFILGGESVAEIKENVSLDLEEEAADEFTTDSNLYQKFELEALNELENQFYAAWASFPPASHTPEFVAALADVLVDDARQTYGPHGRTGTWFRDLLGTKIADYLLTVVKPDLDKEVRKQENQRLIWGSISGGVSGAIIGGALGGSGEKGSLGKMFLGGTVGLLFGSVVGFITAGAINSLTAPSTSSTDPVTQRKRRAHRRHLRDYVLKGHSVFALP
jgi:hypothetical protein